MNQTESLATLYPESDGKPLAENTKQLEWIVKLFGNIQAIYSDDRNVFVASDLLWYHDKDNPDERRAPDVMVVFGRPNKDRSTYLQWDEDDIGPEVVFELRSPSNDDREMADKLTDYDEWGVQEYYVYDPDRNILQIYERGLQTLRAIRPAGPYFSKKLKIGFVLTPKTLEVSYPDGSPFLMPKELRRLRIQAEDRANQEEQKRIEAEERLRIEEQKRIEAEERSRVDQQKLVDAEAKSKASDEQFRRMRELGRKANLNQATDEERAELDRLYQES